MNNTIKTSINQGKLRKNYHPDDSRIRLPAKKNLIIKHIQETIRDKGQFTKARSTIANLFNVSERYVTIIYKQLSDDPSYKVSHKQGFTVQIKFSCLSSSIQTELFQESSLVKNYISKPYLPTLRFLPFQKAVRKKVRVRHEKKREKRKKDLVMRNLPDMKHVEFTEHGKAKMGVYPDEALIYADAQMKLARTKEPVRLFCYLAKDYCEKNNLKIDWQLWFKYKETHNLTETIPFLSLKVNPKSDSVANSKNGNDTVPSSIKDQIATVVSRKAHKLFSEGKRSQFYVMRKLEEFAQNYPQAQQDWQEWIQTDDGKRFSNWIQIYSNQLELKNYSSYHDWDPFSFNYAEHRERIMAEDERRRKVLL